jgi:hypothetical protein
MQGGRGSRASACRVYMNPGPSSVPYELDPFRESEQQPPPHAMEPEPRPPASVGDGDFVG